MDSELKRLGLIFEQIIDWKAAAERQQRARIRRGFLIVAAVMVLIELAR